jgi:hypothetical protein
MMPLHFLVGEELEVCHAGRREVEAYVGTRLDVSIGMGWDYGREEGEGKQGSGACS